MAGRRMGVEEELFLVDVETARLRPVSDRVLRTDEELNTGDEPIPVVQQELFLEQVETATEPCVTLDEITDQLRDARRRADKAAQTAGAAIAAAGTVIDEPAMLTPKGRYQRMAELHGMTTLESLICGTHVHVEIADDTEAVHVLDRIRPWLPVLLALSANSPFWRGQDTGYASFRAQVVRRWPSAGATEPFETPQAYREAVADLIRTGAAVDEAMVYFDARLAARYPTLEIRVADTCTDLSDTVLLAALSRALVETAAGQRELPPWRAETLRGATWRASRWGLSRDLVHPLERTLAPAFDVLDALVGHVHDALDRAGDTGTVRTAIDRLRMRGTGSVRQRAAQAREPEGSAVTRDVVGRTRATFE